MLNTFKRKIQLSLVKNNYRHTITALLFSVLLLTTGLQANGELDSPKKQMRLGISAEDVICKTGFDLVIRTNGFAACVRPDTAEKMQKIGIAFIPIRITDSEKAETIPVEKIQELEIKDSQIITSESKKAIDVVPASGAIVNFYITDQDLNLAHSGIETISTEGLFEFTINGISINGPQTIVETGPNTGQFYGRLILPDTINGKQLSQEDIVLIKYLDESDISGEQKILVKSVPLTKTTAKVQTSGDRSRIGHEFTIRLYEPDANRDSKDEDKIPLSKMEYRGEGGIRTTLSNSDFDANRKYLVETGPNTNMFEVQIKIPREIDGNVVHIGDWYEIRYIDRSTPSDTSEKIILKGKIG